MGNSYVFHAPVVASFIYADIMPDTFSFLNYVGVISWSLILKCSSRLSVFWHQYFGISVLLPAMQITSLIIKP